MLTYSFNLRYDGFRLVLVLFTVYPSRPPRCPFFHLGPAAPAPPRYHTATRANTATNVHGNQRPQRLTSAATSVHKATSACQPISCGVHNGNMLENAPRCSIDCILVCLANENNECIYRQNSGKNRGRIGVMWQADGCKHYLTNVWIDSLLPPHESQVATT